MRYRDDLELALASPSFFVTVFLEGYTIVVIVLSVLFVLIVFTLLLGAILLVG